MKTKISLLKSAFVASALLVGGNAFALNSAPTIDGVTPPSVLAMEHILPTEIQMGTEMGQTFTWNSDAPLQTVSIAPFGTSYDTVFTIYEGKVACTGTTVYEQNLAVPANGIDLSIVRLDAPVSLVNNTDYTMCFESSANMMLRVDRHTHPDHIEDFAGGEFVNRDLILDVYDLMFQLNAPLPQAEIAVQVAENTTFAYDVNATDAEGDDITYSIVDGLDATSFAIDATTGVLDFASAPDFEIPSDTDADNVYKVVVKVSDGTSDNNATIAITVTDVDPENSPPIATNVTFTGTLQVGETLTGSYDYADVENDVENGTIFKWYSSDDASGLNKTEITDANATSYTLTSADEGKYISFEVTPINANGTGVAVESDVNVNAVAPIAVVIRPMLDPTNSVPADDATDVNATADIVLDFNINIRNNDIQPLTTINLYESNGTLIESFTANNFYSLIGSNGGSAVIGNGTNAETSDKITLNPATDLVNGSSYYINILADSHLVDNTNEANLVVPVTDTTTYNFTVGTVVVPTPDTPPTATNTTFTGTLQVGETLTGSYDYADVENDVENGTTFKWYSSNDASGTNKVEITDANTTSYTLTSSDESKYISFEVTPKNDNGTGSSVESSISLSAVIPIETSYTVGDGEIVTTVSANDVPGAIATEEDGNNIITAEHTVDGFIYRAIVTTDPEGNTVSVIVEINISTNEEKTLSTQDYPLGTNITIYIDDNGMLVIRTEIETNKLTID